MLVAEIPKNKNEKIIISIQDFQNKRYLDVRSYFLADDGTWRPTKRGVKVGAGAFKEFIEALKLVNKELVRAMKGEGRKRGRDSGTNV